MNAVTHLEKVITGEVSAVTHLEKVIAGETSAVTYTEKVITGEAPPITHLQKVIAGEASPVTHLEHIWAGGSPTPTEHEYTGAVPVTFNADGEPLLDYLISGNMQQTGTPTPDNPIQPSETGERTGNLLQLSSIAETSLNGVTYRVQGNSLYIDGKSTAAFGIDIRGAFALNAGTYTNQMYGFTGKRIYYSFNNDTNTMCVSDVNTYKTFTISGSTTYEKALVWINNNVVFDNERIDFALFESATPKDFEPYGIKIPISSANTTTPVYLGEVETTRKIKKYEFTGTESISSNTLGVSKVGFTIAISDMLSNGRKNGYCTHFVAQNSPSGSSLDGITYGVSDKVLYVTFSVATATAYNLTDVTSVKTWLSQQYANGTPVTVWYVLATEETGIVNEPIRKIGDYADTLSMEQAGVSIPTNNGSTTVDVETTLKPSEVYIKYKGV